MTSQKADMIKRIVGLECEYGLTFSPTGRVYLPVEKILGYIFEGLIPNSWPSNAFLTNGARFYQDTGCHPEYSTPECDDLIDLVMHDKAGERILESCLPIAEERLREEGLSGDIFIFKNNTDSLGNTYGSHENFLMRRDVDFWKVSEQLIPFFVTRQIYSGAGKILKVSGKSQFFISQRAQHIHEKTSSSTTSSRSIINTRDEPHSDAEKFRRLHIILGDSNMSEFSTYLKVGTAMIVLSMIEDGYSIPNIELEEPVKAIRDISRDPTLTKTVRLENGRELTALDIQQIFWERAGDYLHAQPPHKIFAEIHEEWGRVLRTLAQAPMELVREIDWVTKKWLMENYMANKSCGWDDPRLTMMDLQYHDINRKRGLFYLLAERQGIRKLVDEEAIEQAEARGSSSKKEEKRYPSWPRVLWDVLPSIAEARPTLWIRI